MKGHVIGEITKPMFILIGTWDPLIEYYVSLLKELVECSKQDNCSPVIVILDPSPAIFIRKIRAPIFDDIEFRKEFMKSIGIEGFIIVQMAESDLNEGFNTFYDVISEFGVLKSLWLHSAQTLGRGVKGSQVYIRRFGEKFDFEVKVITFKNKISSSRNDVQHLLSKGELSEAINIVGNQSFWKKPEQDFIKITGWKTGNYNAIPLESPFQKANNNNSILISISGLIPDKSYIKWPSQEIEWLKFIS